MRWIHEMYLLRANRLQRMGLFFFLFFLFFAKRRSHLSLHFSLILHGAEVALGTLKHRLVASAEVTVPSVAAPAGQRRAITALWLSMWFPPINLREMAPLKFHYSFHHDSRSPTSPPLLSVKAPPPPVNAAIRDVGRQAMPRMRCGAWLLFSRPVWLCAGRKLTVQINSRLCARASIGVPVGITATVEMFWGFISINVDSLNICAGQVRVRRHHSNTRIFGSHIFFDNLRELWLF